MRTQRLDENREKFSTYSVFGKQIHKTRERTPLFSAGALSGAEWALRRPAAVTLALLMTAAVIKHDVNHFSRENTENATARQKP